MQSIRTIQQRIYKSLFFAISRHKSVAISRFELDVRGDSHPSPRKGLDWIPFKQQPCCQPTRLNAPVREVVQQFFSDPVAVGNLKLWLLLSAIADAREEQGEQDFGEAVVTANGLVLMDGLYSRRFSGPATLLAESAF